MAERGDVLMGFSLDIHVPVITVFLQEFISFFSPCILPLLPLYVSYLSAGAKREEQDGNGLAHRGRVIVNTQRISYEAATARLLAAFANSRKGSDKTG